MPTASSHTTGVLLLNLGTPASPRPRDVGRYLRQFLMDPLVIDIPYILRWILVNVLIVPRRRHASAKLYAKIWTPQGSPLLLHTLALAKHVQVKLGERYAVEPGMRYGDPAIGVALQNLKQRGISKLVVLPLYPQYSLAATKSSEVEVARQAAKILPGIPVQICPAFYADEAFLNAATIIYKRAVASMKFDLALFSFHGLPERQVSRTDSTGQHCLQSANCCDAIVDANRNCYRAQCFATARALAERLAIPSAKYRVCFQSRLGSTPWIRPYTDEFYRTLPSEGVRDVIVFSPSFVADCLETLEEVQIRGAEEFRANGGNSLTLVPSLNSEPAWVDAVCKIVTILNH